MGDSLSIAIQILEAVALLTLGVGLIVFAVVFRRFLVGVTRIEESLERLTRDARPVFDRARAVGENLNYMVTTVRKEVERAGATVERAHERLDEAIEAAEERVRELGTVLDMAKDEVEDTLLTATSALRGLRTGARVLTSRRQQGSDGSESKGGDEGQDD